MLKIALRNLSRNKAFSFINIFGLSVGLATCLLIMLYTIDESGYDKHHKDADRIFRVASIDTKGETWAALAGPVAWRLKTDLPEVEQVTRLLTFTDIEKMLLTYDNHSVKKEFFETNGYYVDSTFFQVLTYDFKYGKPAIALNDPNTMVISESLSEKFFGAADPTGKLININTPFGRFDYTITGVFYTKNKSHIPASYFLCMHNKDMYNWVQARTSAATNSLFFTYVKLRAGTDSKAFDQKLKPFYEHLAGAEMKAAGFSKTLFIQPVKDIYLHSNLGNEIAANGNITYLYILSSIAAFILLIACINFMNLTTARSEKRAKEVGVRKTLGAEKNALIWQFLGESFLMCMVGLVLASLVAMLLLPVLNGLTNKSLNPFDKPVLVLWIIALTLFTGLLSGLYPAFYLSSFKPASILKGKLANNFTATAIRKGLVVFQFTISICLVLGAIVIWQQLNLLKNTNLGFNKSQQIVLPLQQGYNNTETNYTTLRNELLKNPAIKSVTSGSSYPGIVNLNDMIFYAEDKTINDIVDISLVTVENDYFETLGIKVLQGRVFSKEYRADSASIVLNEAAVKNLGYSVNNAVGRNIKYDFGTFHSSMKIIGVVKDFNFEDLHHAIKPISFTNKLFGNKYGYLVASLNTSDYSKLLSSLEKSWNKIIPSSPFVYSFLDQDFQRNYDKEQRTSSIVVYFTSIAIFIACLGLFGLAAFSAEQRIKEIGIRKVLGASVTNVTTLLSKDFIKLVMISILIASPIAWYVMNKWLQDFEYHITISWWMFLLAGALAVVIALVTVSTQAIKAAVGNPVKSLKNNC